MFLFVCFAFFKSWNNFLVFFWVFLFLFLFFFVFFLEGADNQKIGRYWIRKGCGHLRDQCNNPQKGLVLCPMITCKVSCNLDLCHAFMSEIFSVTSGLMFLVKQFLQIHSSVLALSGLGCLWSIFLTILIVWSKRGEIWVCTVYGIKTCKSVGDHM